MAKKFDYADWLGNSFKQLFQNPKLLVPLFLFIAAGFVINIFYIPSLAPILEGVFDFKFLLYIPIIFIVSVIFYGWLYASIRNVIYKKPLNIKKDFSKGLSYAWKLLGLWILMFLLFVGIFLIFFLIGILIFFAITAIPAIGISLAILVGIIAFIVFLFFGAWAAYAPIMLITDNLKVVDTIKRTYNFLMKNKGHCIAMLVITLLITIVVGILGNTIVYAFVPADQVQFFLVQSPILYVLLTLPSSILATLAWAWMQLYYFNAYKKKK